MMLESGREWEMDTWELPKPLPRVEWRPRVHVCPYVGLPLPHNPKVEHLKQLWFAYDIQNWHIKPFRRRSLYSILKRNLDAWAEWLRVDSTPTFYKEIQTYRKANDGAVIGIQGPKGSGKSWLGQMVLTRVVDSTPHVLFKYSDLEMHVSERDNLALGVQIDEDLKATGAESKNLVIHINNSFETSRKAELWAVCTGVNLSFEGWGDTLDLRLIPFGYNARYQATRAAVWSKEREFLGFVVFQRKHLPDDPVLYYNDMGYWGEYKARAVNYSRTVTKEGGASGAVSSEQQDKHIARLKMELRLHYIDKNLEIPNDVMCRRIYRKAGLPSKSIGYVNEVIQWSKFELESTAKPANGTPLDIAGWDGLKAGLNSLILRYGGTDRQAEKATAWLVPDWPERSQTQVAGDFGLGRDSIQKAVSRGLADIPTVALGNLGEQFLASHIDSSPVLNVEGLHIAKGKKGPPDIYFKHDGREIAINAKLVLKEPRFRRSVETTPEDAFMPDAFACLVMARRLELRLFPITGPETMLNDDKGVLCAPEKIGEKLLEVIE